MTSKERHELRYQRRKAKRERKRLEYAKQFLVAEKVFGTAALIKSAYKCKQGVNWKPSVQSYMANVVLNSSRASRRIMKGTWRTQGFNEFDIIERGKPRHIKSVSFEERCIQRSLCDNCITSILSRYLIHDNGATLSGKGTDFALDRLTEHLHQFYRKHERNGYILFFDFSQYFANIDIEELYKRVCKYVPDSLHRRMYKHFIDAFKNEGLGLGSQVSQISAIFYANELDHYIKDRLGVKYYARYMDDGYIIAYNLDVLKDIFNQLKRVCASLKIRLNKKKCQIVSLKHQFRFLKIRFFLTENGRVVRRLSKDSVTKERNKLKKFKSLISQNKLTYLEVYNAFNSWMYSQKRGKNFHILKNMLKLYIDLFKRYKLRNRSTNLRVHHTIKFLSKQLEVAA